MAVPNKMKIPVGTILAGKYRITREIGRGGMATVHEAENVDIGKRIAIKVLAQELTGSSIVVERFLREARAAAAIRSPYICDVYDSGKLPSGQPFLVLELLEGESLYERMTRQRQLDVATTVQVITQVCRGLTKAHAASIVHRDLKPENIFLTKDEDGNLLAKILDFGLAKFYTPTTKDQTRLTREGAVFGTPAYMSPEQVRGQGAVDHRADLWALGCITYECFTGKTVWSTDQGVAMTFAQIASAPLPRPARYRPDLPVAFTEWFDRTLDRDINKRFQTAKEFAEALAVSCGLDRRETSEIRSAPVGARAEAAAALAAPQSAPAPMSPRTPEPASGRVPAHHAAQPAAAQAPVDPSQFQPIEGADEDGDPTRVLAKRPLVRPLETGAPRPSDDPRMERFRRGPDGRIAKVVPQVAPNAPPVPAPPTPLPGSHRAPHAHAPHAQAQAHAHAQARSPASQRPPPLQAVPAQPPRPRPAHHGPPDQDSEIVKNPFAKARRRQRVILVITLLVIAVVVALFVALSSSTPSSGSEAVDTGAAPSAAPSAAATAAAPATASAAPSATAAAPPRPPPAALPAWLADVREAQTALAAGDVKTASAKLGQAAARSGQHGAAQGLARQVASAIWVRGACTLAGIARPRTYDLADAGAKRVPATRPSVIASGSGALAAWTDAHTGASHAYVAHLDGAFALSGAAVDVTPDGGDVRSVTLAAWGDRLVALYTDAKTGAAGTYARWLGADGKPAGLPVRVGPPKSAEGAPALVVAPGRALYAAWSEEGDRDSEDLFVQKLSQATLSPEGAPARVTDLAPVGAGRARALGPRGVVAKEALHLVFELERKPASYAEHQTIPLADLGRGLSPAGTNREGKAAGTLSLANQDRGRAHAPDVACTSEMCFVVWHGESPRGAHGIAVDPVSGRQVWRRTFSPFAGYPVVTASPSGGAVAAWNENGRVVVAPLVRAGFARAAKVGRAQGDQAVIALAPGAAKGQYLAAWLDVESNEPEPYVARLACP